MFIDVVALPLFQRIAQAFPGSTPLLYCGKHIPTLPWGGGRAGGL